MNSFCLEKCAKIIRFFFRFALSLWCAMRVYRNTGAYFVNISRDTQAARICVRRNVSPVSPYYCHFNLFIHEILHADLVWSVCSSFTFAEKNTPNFTAWSWCVPISSEIYTHWRYTTVTNPTISLPVKLI